MTNFLPTLHSHAGIQSSDGFLNTLRTILTPHLLVDYRKAIHEEYLSQKSFGLPFDVGSCLSCSPSLIQETEDTVVSKTGSLLLWNVHSNAKKPLVTNKCVFENSYNCHKEKERGP